LRKDDLYEEGYCGVGKVRLTSMAMWAMKVKTTCPGIFVGIYARGGGRDTMVVHPFTGRDNGKAF
jgi:hypothetical protein